MSSETSMSGSKFPSSQEWVHAQIRMPKPASRRERCQLCADHGITKAKIIITGFIG